MLMIVILLILLINFVLIFAHDQINTRNQKLIVNKLDEIISLLSNDD